MKWKAILAAASLSSLLLTACGAGDKNANDTALRNQDLNEPTRVNYNPYNNTGNFNNNAYGTFDNNVARNYNTNNVTRNVNNNTNRNFDNNSVNRNVNNNNNNKNRMTVADKAANKIAAMREVDQANVIVTNNNAYVAAKLANNAGNGLAKNVENKISDLVKSTDRDIDHVYVSVNPDFYERTTSYANDIRSGRPVAGLFDEFSTMVRRIFPSER